MKIINSYFNSLSPQMYSMFLVAFVLAIVFIIIGNYFSKLAVDDKVNKAGVLVLVYYEFIEDLCTSVFGNYLKWVKPYAGMLFILILTSNYLPLFLPIPSPTTDYNFTLGLTVISMLLMYGIDYKFNGAKAHFKEYLEPIKVMLPLNIMEIISRPLSLSMRLFVNILSGTIIIGLFDGAILQLQNLIIGLVYAPGSFLANLNILGALIGIPFHVYFDLFAGGLQAFVFTLLTLVFASQSVDFDRMEES